MEKYNEPERKIQPYKTTCRKCETEEDLRDMVRLASENINGNCRGNEPVIIANKLDNPADILNAPDNISNQLLGLQAVILGDDRCRSRRVNFITYSIDKKKYGVVKEDATLLMEGLVNAYPEYESVAVMTESKGVIRIDHVLNNLNENGTRLTQKFSPWTLYNLYKEQRKQKKRTDKEAVEHDTSEKQ